MGNIHCTGERRKMENQLETGFNASTSSLLESNIAARGLAV